MSSSFPPGFACSVPVPAIVSDGKMDWKHLIHRVLIGLLSVQPARQKQPVLQRGSSCKAESPRESRSKSPSRGPLTRLCLVQELCCVSVSTGPSSNHKHLEKLVVEDLKRNLPICHLHPGFCHMRASDDPFSWMA